MPDKGHEGCGCHERHDTASSGRDAERNPTVKANNKGHP